jgi:hypothetical protein
MGNNSEAPALSAEDMTTVAREAMRPASLRLILDYTVEDRRQKAERTEHRRRREDAPDQASTESND